ncbi:MAG TPA: hypothetical protein VIC29_20185 [Steroidobacteraceae bacterium]
MSEAAIPNIPSPRMRAAALFAAAVLAASALVGCASGPKPTAQLVRASTQVARAALSRQDAIRR